MGGDDPRVYCNKHKAFVSEFRRVFCVDHVDGCFGDSIWRRYGDVKGSDEVGVAHSGRDRDYMFSVASSEERKKRVDGSYHADNVHSELLVGLDDVQWR